MMFEHPFRKKSKYHNKKCQCLSKHIHDSKFEASYCNRLLAMKKNGEIVDFKVQQVFNFTVNGHLICQHYADFLVYYLPPGAIVKFGICSETSVKFMEVHEVKGHETEAWKIKRKLFKALFPTVPYLVIKKGDSSGRIK